MNDSSDNGTFHYGCLIQVRDLEAVRLFYEKTLDLGTPILDSNFWVEFALPGNGILVLEQNSAVATEVNKQDVSCLIGIEHFELFMKTLETRDVKTVRPARTIPGRKTATLRDPEGNLVTLYSRVVDE